MCITGQPVHVLHVLACDGRDGPAPTHCFLDGSSQTALQILALDGDLFRMTGVIILTVERESCGDKSTVWARKRRVLDNGGEHLGGPSISVGFPSFILPFYTTETNGSRRLTDMLKVCAGCCRREIGSCGARVRVKPFLHVDLELVLGMLVFKDVGHLSGAPVVVALTCLMITEKVLEG